MEYASRHLNCTPAPFFLPRFRLSSPPHTHIHTHTRGRSSIMQLQLSGHASSPSLPASPAVVRLVCLMPGCATLPHSDSGRVLVSDGVLVNPASSPVVCFFFFSLSPSATHHRQSISPLHAPGVWLGRAPGPDHLLFLLHLHLLLLGARSCQRGAR